MQHESSSRIPGAAMSLREILSLLACVCVLLSFVLLLWFAVGKSHAPSAEAAKKRKAKDKEKRKQIKKKKSADVDTTTLPSYVEVKVKWVIRYPKFTDEYVRRNYANKFAWPRGFESFVDEWPESNDFKIPANEVWVAKDAGTQEVLYWAGGQALQHAGLEDKEIAGFFNTLSHVDMCVNTNMSGKRGVASGNGFIGAMGIRYRYTEQEESELDKLGPTASQNKKLYQSVLKVVQQVANLVVVIVSTWDVELKAELDETRQNLQKILPVTGTASHTFPMASVGKNGAFACHQDKRDTRRTLWASMRSGGIAFPAYQHALLLSAGDVVVFNGKDHYHANIVYPCDREEAEHLPEYLQNLIISLYYQSQQAAYLENRAEREQAAKKDVELANRIVEVGANSLDDLHDIDIFREACPLQLTRIRNLARQYIVLKSMSMEPEGFAKEIEQYVSI